MNALLRVTSSRVLVKMKRNPEYAKLIGLKDDSKLNYGSTQIIPHESGKPEGGQERGRQ